MTAPTAVRPHPSTRAQWWVLTTRLIGPSLRNGELVVAIGTSVVFTASFYVPLNNLMRVFTIDISSSYGQFIAPLIILQAAAFAALATGYRAAGDSQVNVYRRFKSMPIAPMTPMLARVAAALYRCSVGLTASLICTHVIGFRFHRGIGFIIGFCVLVLVIGVVLAFTADLTGTATKNPETMAAFLVTPPLILGILSTGIQPASAFPAWIQPAVRNQPVSQFVEALRSLAGDTIGPASGPVAWGAILATLLWLLGLAVALVLVSKYVLSRRS